VKPQILPLLLLLALAGCSKGRGEGDPAAGAARAPAAVAQGVVEPEGGLVHVLAPRDGVLGRPLVAEGDHVAAGQPLEQIQDRQARLGLDVSAADLADRQAQAEVAAAKAQGAARDAQRLARLAQADAATRQDAEQAATAAAVAAGEHRQAIAALRAAQARRQLDAFEVEVRDVRAPVAGRIVRRTAAAGAFVSAASPLFVLEPDGQRVIRAELDEAFADKVKPGMTAVVTKEFQQGVSYRAQVLRVSDLMAGPSLQDDQTAKAEARVVTVFLALPGADLRIGQRVLVRFAP
jgi:multidrug resistance efflux pump